MNKNPLMRTPGELLSRARAEQSLTLDELSERTKIPPPVLEALEKDEYHKISGPLYIKSFLRTCAVDLGIDSEQVLDLYNKFAGEAQASSPGQETVWQEEVEVSHVGLPWPRIIMVAGTVVVLIGLLLFALRGCGDDSVPSVADTGTQEEAAVVSSAPAAGQGDSLAPSGAEPGHQSLLARDAAGHPDAALDPDGATGAAAGEPSDAAAARDDTLALGWLLGKDLPVETRPESRPASAAIDADETRQAARQEPAAAATTRGAAASATAKPTPPEPKPTTSDEMDEPAETVVSTQPLVPGDPDVDFADGKIYPVVLKLVCREPLRADIKRDGDTAFLGALWPHTGKPAPTVPAKGVEQGWAYAADGGLMVFWGARDYFSLRLGRLDGVQVFVNGERRDLAGIRAGDEFLLFPPAAASPDGG